MEDDAMKTRTCLLVGVTLLGIVVASPALAQSAGPGRPPLFAVLLGGHEVSDEGQANAGDPDGVGSATVLFAATTVCFGLTVNNLDEPIGAHIHQGRAGVNGPIVVPFTAPENGDPGASSGCTPDVDPDLVEEIRTHPGEFYVNVHTGPFPAGAIRGQLF
jgi:CHRD domain-containing protein